MTQRISFNPDPATEGQAVDICYDFTGIDSDDPVDLDLKWSPESVTGPTRVTVSKGSPCSGVTCPIGSTGLLAEDTTGLSPDNSVAIQAAPP